MSSAGHRIWPEQKLAAVSLTYDCVRAACNVMPVLKELERRGWRGTFYLDPISLLDNLQIWKAASRRGHEVGNGCLIGGARPDGGFPLWTLEAIAQEIDATDALIRDVLPNQREHSFGFPLGTPLCAHGADYRDLLSGYGPAARSGVPGINPPMSCDLGYLRALHMNALGAAESIAGVEAALEHGSWAVLAFRDLDENTSKEILNAHAAVLDWIQARETDFYVSTVTQIASRLRTGRPGSVHLL